LTSHHPGGRAFDLIVDLKRGLGVHDGLPAFPELLEREGSCSSDRRPHLAGRQISRAIATAFS
jgi:hypothetical protein